MVEAVMALLTGDPKVLTARDVASIDLLIELQRPVYDFGGTQLVAGWQPQDLPGYVTAYEASGMKGSLTEVTALEVGVPAVTR